MIFLLGTRHSLQIKSDAVRAGDSLDATLAQVDALGATIRRLAQERQLSLIAEELSEEVVSLRGASASSVARDAAAELGVRHVFCDPNTEERRARGIAHGEQFDEREAFWIERLVSSGDLRGVLFVCGANHVDSFSERLKRGNFDVEVIYRDWEPE